jgi:hypothetical protein
VGTVTEYVSLLTRAARWKTSFPSTKMRATVPSPQGSGVVSIQLPEKRTVSGELLVVARYQ